MEFFFLKRKKIIFWNSDFILVPCRASSLTVKMMFGFSISDQQNSRNYSSTGAPLFFMCSYWAVYLLLYLIYQLTKIPKVCSNVNKNDVQIINCFILMVCQNKIAKKSFKKSAFTLDDPLNYPHSTEIFKKYCRNIPWNYCKIARIFQNLSLILLKYCNNLAMSAQNMTYAIFSNYYQNQKMHK